MVDCDHHERRSVDACAPVVEASENALRALLLQSSVTAQAIARASGVVINIVHQAIAMFGSRYNESLAVNRLPSELLCDILMQLPFRDRIEASHVCKAWRDRALAHAQLWTALKLTGNNVRSGCLVDLLERSRGAGVDVELFVPRAQYEAEREDFAAVTSVITAHLHHMRSLKLLCDEETDWDALLAALACSAPMLESLTIRTGPGATGGISADFLAGHAPWLRRVRLEHVRLLSDTDAPALASTVELAYIQQEMSAGDLRHLFSSTPCLELLTLSTVVRSSLARHPPVAAFSPLSLAPRFHSLRLDCTGRDAEEMLEAIVTSDIQHISMSFPTAQTLNSLLLAEPHMRELTIEPAKYTNTFRVQGTEPTSRKIRAFDAVASALATHLLDNQSLFARVTTLVLPEQLWPGAHGVFPNSPSLTRLEVLLALNEHSRLYSPAAHAFIGLFELEVLGRWRCPALRELTFRAVGADEGRRMSVQARHLHSFIQRSLYFDTPQLHSLQLVGVEVEDEGDAVTALRAVVMEMKAT